MTTSFRKMSQIVLIFFTMLLATSVFAQDPAQYGTPYAGVPGRADVNMYQAHIRPYSAAGNLAGVSARLDAIRALGTNVLYLMPIYPMGSSNSPYAITDFKGIAAEYGSLTDLRNLVAAAHTKGMAVIMDVAINGTAWTHPWITQHPDWYVRNGTVIQQLSTYSDVAALNFGNSTMRAALVDALRYWIFAANIDGFRCDFANNPPLDFWTNTNNNLRGITSHKLILFAEGDRQTNLQAGFDMNFGDQFYWQALTNIKNGGSVTTNLVNSTNYEYANATGDQQVVRYTANHDTEGSTTAISMFTNHAGVIANFMVAAYMRGVPMITSGQEVDFNQTIPWPYNTVKINWGANTGAAADFTKVLNFRTASTAIRRGTMTNYSDANVAAFTKISGTEKVVVMVNLRNGTNNYVIPAAFAGSYTDAYTGAAVTLTSGASQSLAAYGYRVLKNAAVGNSLTVSPTSLSVGSAAGTSTIAVTSNVSWTTTDNQTWITVTPASGSNNANITVSVTANTGAARSGTVTVTGGSITQTINVSQSAASTGSTYYTIRNRWNNMYLQDAGANVGYGSTVANNNYKWEKVAVDATYFWLKNLGTGEYMHIENQTGSVQCATVDLTWWSGQWSQDNIDGTWVRIRNRWQTGSIIHVENQNGSAQYAGGQDGWYSAQWQLATTSGRLAVHGESIGDNEVLVETFPNPATGKQLNVNISGLRENETATFTIHDINGNIKLDTNVKGSEKIEHDLPAGFYFVRVRTDRMNVTRKLIIE